MFRGREVTHPERGTALLDRLAGELSEIAVVEQSPIQDGRNMTMMLAPSKAVLAGEKDQHDDEDDHAEVARQAEPSRARPRRGGGRGRAPATAAAATVGLRALRARPTPPPRRPSLQTKPTPDGEICTRAEAARPRRAVCFTSRLRHAEDEDPFRRQEALPLTATGKVRGRHAFSSHILEKKSPKRKRRMGRPGGHLQAR